jgi:hypothetical protein
VSITPLLVLQGHLREEPCLGCDAQTRLEAMTSWLDPCPKPDIQVTQFNNVSQNEIELPRLRSNKGI